MINGNESEIISVINGTFQYNGQTYVASQEYINQAVAYLDSDGVDCTDTQKAKALSQIYGSVADGVAEGYLVPAGGGNANQQAAGKESKAAAEQSGSGKQSTAAAESTGESAESTLSAEEQAALAEKESLEAESRAKAEAELAEHFRKTHNPLVLALEEVSTADSTAGAGKTAEVQAVPFPEGVLRTACPAVTGLILIAVIAGILNKRYRAAGHRRKPRQIRHALSFAMAGCMAASIVLLTGLMTLHFGFYRQENLSQAFTETDYYEVNYRTAKQEIDAVTAAIGIPESVLSGQDIEQWYKFEMRKTVLRNSESGYFEKTVIKNVQKPINDYLSSQDIELTPLASRGLANMITSVVKSFRAGVEIPGLDAWYKAAELEAGASARWTAICSFLLLAAAGTILLVQQHKKHAVVYLGYGFMAGAAADIAFYAVIRMRGAELAERFWGITAGELLRYMLQHSLIVYLMMTAIAGLGGLILILLGRRLTER